VPEGRGLLTRPLVSFTQTIVATGETIDIFGKAPRGFMNYGRDGRRMPLIVKDERPRPADLAKMTDQERAELFWLRLGCRLRAIYPSLPVFPKLPYLTIPSDSI